MGRQVRRVPVDFEWPLNERWSGFLIPDRLNEARCTDCKHGYSPHAEYLHSLWYGHVPFNPMDTGSTPLTAETPAVRAFAERNVASGPEFYGTGEAVIVREASRLARLWNGMWLHHLSQDDVDELVAAGRLYDFTHSWSRESGWVAKNPPVPVPAAEVNVWSLRGLGLDSISSGVVIRARCEREGKPPVFPEAEGLIEWMSSPAYTWGASEPLTREQAERFVTGTGWAPTLVHTPESGLVPGEAAAL